MVGKQDRRLEVVVLGARNLSEAAIGAAAIGGEGRRKVQITIVCGKDPDGLAFGAKVSPWTQPHPRDARQLRFGQSGLKCVFPLDSSQGAPHLAADVRFLESAQLRVRLLASMVPTVPETTLLSAALSLLPTSVTTGVSKELDEATAQIEGEVLIPLTNILSGRVGFAADRALGGWVPLTRPSNSTELEVVEDQPPALWMQLYALPDHEAWLPSLGQQIQEELERMSKAPTAPSGAATAPSAATAPRWGNGQGQTFTRSPAVGSSALPLAQKTSSSNPAPAATVRNLIDVSLDDDEELIPASSAGADVLSYLDPTPSLLEETLSMPAVPPRQDELQESSAFGFIAAGSPGSQLDLAALYSSPQRVAPPESTSPISAARFEALNGLSSLGSLPSNMQKPTGASTSGQGGSLKSLEESALEGLSQSLRF